MIKSREFLISAIRILTLRLFALVAGILLSVSNSGNILQTIFGVLGIVFSVSISTVIGIDLSKVRNTTYRNRFKSSLNSVVVSLTIDLLISSLLITLGLIDSTKYLYIFRLSVHIPTVAITSGIISLFTQVYSFYRLFRFKIDLTEKIIGEEKE